ncbi:hypothetical protein A5787_18700 [Mycobacterium sp. 852002-50816_SCH5313054-b]|uniref:DUF6912 family protein n=1 Tax=Mycobacterium sp. 852002-50816_SCH5313054-b TaxID=1834092 RepID=UPI0007FE7760|nr:hypothetical protein [Mycobacterium sp. 852002-50816_SCH5313054-b]OBF60798.1 hypothetical protein A5787_18700 [Mycobacterium sp. 852002-50816_SCH5313054-b]
MIQVYIPATLAMLRQLVADGSLWPVNGTAFAVTPTLREAYAEGDDDELADVALREAALASVRLLASQEDRAPEGSEADAGLPPRRAVLAAEVEVGESGAKYRPDLDDAVVRLAAPVTIDQVVAAYVDNAAAEPDVTRAIEVIDAADLGDEDAELVVGDAQDHDLAWYANQELPFLLELL